MVFIGWVMTVNGFISCQTAGYFQLRAKCRKNSAVEDLKHKPADVLESVPLEIGPAIAIIPIGNVKA